MRFNIFVLTTILSATVLFVGCGGSGETPTNSSNRNVANAPSNTGASNANNPLGTTRTPEAATSNNAPTIAPVVQSFYDALRRKDEAGVKKYLSQSALKYWQDEMKTEKKTSLLAILEENETPIEEKREVRNEQIQGDSAIAEMKGGSLGVWTKVRFVKENGEWKFGSPSESIDLEEIKPKSSSNSKNT